MNFIVNDQDATLQRTLTYCFIHKRGNMYGIFIEPLPMELSTVAQPNLMSWLIPGKQKLRHPETGVNHEGSLSS